MSSTLQGRDVKSVLQLASGCAAKKGQNSGEDPGLPDPEALEPHASLLFIPAMRHYHWGITSHLRFPWGNKLYNIVIENCLHFKYF